MLCGDLYQLLGIGRMMTANDNNDVALLAEVFRFLLPRPRRITYCIKNSGVCIGFFEKLRTFLPFCYLKCGLCNCKNGLLGVRRPFPRLQLGQIAENEYLSPGMSDDALHLRMGRITGHHEHCTGGFGLGSDLLYLLHEGAGSIVISAAPGFQLVVNAAGDTVAADDHLVARRDISGGVCYQCAPALKVFHGLGVVDEGAEGGHLAALIQQTVGQFDRAVHAEAETRSLCKSDFHCTLLNSTSPSPLRDAAFLTEGRLWHSARLHLFVRGLPY